MLQFSLASLLAMVAMTQIKGMAVLPADIESSDFEKGANDVVPQLETCGSQKYYPSQVCRVHQPTATAGLIKSTVHLL